MKKEEKIDEEELKEIFNNATNINELDVDEAISLIAQRFTMPYQDENLLSTLTEIANTELVAISTLYPVVKTLEEEYNIVLPFGELIRLILLLRISKYRKGRKEILALVGKLMGNISSLDEKTLKTLFGEK